MKAIDSVSLGKSDFAFVTSYTITAGVQAGRSALEYVADVSYANVYSEIELTGYKAPGQDPGSKAILATAGHALRDLRLTCAPMTTATEAIISTWTSFFDGKTPIYQKAAELQGGTAAKTDIRRFFSLFPQSLDTKVDSVRINGTMASVTYEFYFGATPESTKPMTGTAVSVDGRWLVSHQTWSAWVRRSNILGSG